MENTMGGLTTSAMLEIVEGATAEPKTKKSGKKPARKGMSAMEALKASVQAMQTATERVTALVAALPEILDFVAEVGRHPELLQELSDVPECTWGQILIRLKAGMEKCLSDSALRLAVGAEMIRHMAADSSSRPDEALALLVLIAKKGILEEAKTGFFFGGKHYKLAAWMDPKLSGEVTELAKKASKVPAPTPAPAPQKPAEVKAVKQPPARPSVDLNRQITPMQAWMGKIGKFKLPIPPSNGGGKMCVLELQLQDGGHIFVVQARNGLAEVQSRSIPLSAIKDETGGMRERLVMTPPQLSPEALLSWQIWVERLGGALMRGFQAEVFGQKDLPPIAFLKEEKVGDCMLTCMQFNWCPRGEGEKGSFKELRLRFHRRGDGKVALTEIATPEARSLFGDSVGDYHSPGQAFKGMPLLLGVFLRATYAQVVLGRKPEPEEEPASPVAEEEEPDAAPAEAVTA